jgi:methylated-DNA-[protein]-cysteine S-methyltransferase
MGGASSLGRCRTSQTLACVSPLSTERFPATRHPPKGVKISVMSGAGYVYATFASPVGELTLIALGDALTGLSFETSRRPRVLPEGREDPADPVLVTATEQLREYFDGTRREFDIPLALHGTDFQKRVWNELLKIPFARTRSYGEMAMLLGDPKCTRAVGLANGSNPIAIIVPCHRVIGASGSLVGFGGGLRNKALLLDLERGQPAFDFLTG